MNRGSARSSLDLAPHPLDERADASVRHVRAPAPDALHSASRLNTIPGCREQVEQIELVGRQLDLPAVQSRQAPRGIDVDAMHRDRLRCPDGRSPASTRAGGATARAHAPPARARRMASSGSRRRRLQAEHFVGLSRRAVSIRIGTSLLGGSAGSPGTP